LTYTVDGGARRRFSGEVAVAACYVFGKEETAVREGKRRF